MGLWDQVPGALPFVGTIINGSKAVAHAGMAGIDAIAGDNEDAKDHLAMAGMDAVKAIPFGVGTAATVSELLYDTHAGRATEEHLYDPSAPAYQQTALQDVREWMFGRRADGKQTGRDTHGLW